MLHAHEGDYPYVTQTKDTLIMVEDYRDVLEMIGMFVVILYGCFSWF